MEKIKSFFESSKGKDIMVIFIVVLVGLSSFELGRLSKNDADAGLKVSYTDQQANIILPTENFFNNKSNTDSAVKAVPAVSSSVGKSFFASSRGQKYYSVGCSAGKTIKQENRIYFSTKAEAEKAGYELSSSCLSR